ncbi:cyclic nucleotide-binding domain-containing protein [Bacillus shivajii]|uniref:cyclic nucleotide-binding domain-containing protein n=1 Tax=Bacillus shivajii TaxID=1983719 RepID=UPI001CFAF04F|nr:cyclic nucleotide-binding domain-containing protein [Bacillus shivajii]UCZ51515.1 cyclic nucleotide-binding domain-containing protein [Bacillus shivajii]
MTTASEIYTPIKDTLLTNEFTEEEVHILSNYSQYYFLQKDETLIQEGERQKSLYIIKTGRLGIFQGEASDLFTSLESESMIGEKSIVEVEHHYTYSVKALDPSMVMKIDTYKLFQEQNNHSLQLKLLNKAVKQFSREKITLFLKKMKNVSKQKPTMH